MNEYGSLGGCIRADQDASLTGTIVALNIGSFGTDVSGNFESLNYNFIGTDDANDFTIGTDDIEEGDPLLGPLQNNGGTTFTHELLIGSTAFNAGDPGNNATDQIGQNVFDGRRDIGAFEAQDILLSVNDLDDNAFGVSMYPNPSNGFVTIDIPSTFGENVSLTIIELGSGRIVQKLDVSSNIQELQLNNLSAGIYIIQIISEKQQAIKKLILSK
jgi:hypothetical protein